MRRFLDRAAFGGVPMAGGNPTDASGLQFAGAESGGVLGSGFRSRAGLPVINIAGCAPHPGWITETLAALALGGIDTGALDGFGRPRFFADHLAHHGCARNEYYEFKASAESLSQQGCLMEHLGCKATQAVGDCNQRGWNGNGSCTSGGYPCIACTSPGFETGQQFMETAKVAGIPVGLALGLAGFLGLAAIGGLPYKVFIMLLGLFRMSFPELQLEGAKHTSAVSVEAMLLMLVGLYMTAAAAISLAGLWWTSRAA